MGWSGGGEGGFSVILVVVCTTPHKTLTPVWGGAGGGVLLSQFGGSVQCAS